jgi:hypothetical protein
MDQWVWNINPGVPLFPLPLADGNPLELARRLFGILISLRRENMLAPHLNKKALEDEAEDLPAGVQGRREALKARARLAL